MAVPEKHTVDTGINTDCEYTSKLQKRNVRHIRIQDQRQVHADLTFLETIGQGSFATVISVVDKDTKKHWALKIVGKTDPAIAKTSQREIEILMMVKHPHIIHLERVYESSDKLYMLIEKCQGELLALFKLRKKFTEQEVRLVIIRLADAVSYLHKNDIVHRDLKLENILYMMNPNDKTDDLFIKVTDFGLSIIKSGVGYENMLSEICGTLVYMAPEVLSTKSYSHQCDIWSMGVIMFVLLSGHFPFHSQNQNDLMEMICKKEPTYSGLIVSPEAVNLMTKMFAKNPALRITATEVCHHPWTKGEEITHDSPENVLDMMRLWKSDMKVEDDVGANYSFSDIRSTDTTGMGAFFLSPRSSQQQSNTSLFHVAAGNGKSVALDKVPAINLRKSKTLVGQQKPAKSSRTHIKTGESKTVVTTVPKSDCGGCAVPGPSSKKGSARGRKRSQGSLPHPNRL